MATRDRLPVRIGERRFIVEVPAISRSPLGGIADVQDNQADPAEQSLTNEGLWKRTQEDASLGAGQRNFDLRTDRRPSVRERFRWSRGLDVFSERREVRLLPSVTSEGSVGSSTGTGAVWRKGDRVYASNGTTIWVSNQNDPNTWNVATDSLAGSGIATPQSVAIEGGVVYVADGTSVWDDTTAWNNFTNQFSTTDTDYLVGGSGRLLGMKDNELWEFDADGSKLGGGNIYTHRFPSFNWKGGLSTDNGIYAFGDDGNSSEVYFMVPVDATAELPPPYSALQTNAGETINVMKSFAGVMVIGTSLGLRLANVATNGTLTLGPLMENFGNVRDMWFRGQYAYVTTDDVLDADGVKDNTGLHIVNIGEWTSPLVPAYASHIMSGNANDTSCLSVTELNDQRVMLVRSSGNTAVVYVEDTNSYVSEGRLRTGAITMGVADKHAVSSVELQFDNLPDGSSLSVDYYDRIGGTATDLGTVNDSDETEAIFRTDGTQVNEEPELEIILTRGATVTNEPVLRRWTYRSIIIMRRNEEILLPIKLYPEVTDDIDIGASVTTDPFEDWQYLFSLVANRQLVPVELGSEALIGRLEGLYGGPSRTEGVGFDEWINHGRNGWLTGTVLVAIHTLTDDGVYS